MHGCAWLLFWSIPLQIMAAWKCSSTIHGALSATTFSRIGRLWLRVAVWDTVVQDWTRQRSSMAASGAAPFGWIMSLVQHHPPHFLSAPSLVWASMIAVPLRILCFSVEDNGPLVQEAFSLAMLVVGVQRAPLCPKSARPDSSVLKMRPSWCRVLSVLPER